MGVVPVFFSYLNLMEIFLFLEHFIYPVEGLDFSSIHPSTAIT